MSYEKVSQNVNSFIQSNILVNYKTASTHRYALLKIVEHRNRHRKDLSAHRRVRQRHGQEERLEPRDPRYRRDPNTDFRVATERVPHPLRDSVRQNGGLCHHAGVATI